MSVQKAPRYLCARPRTILAGSRLKRRWRARVFRDGLNLRACVGCRFISGHRSWPRRVGQAQAPLGLSESLKIPTESDDASRTDRPDVPALGTATTSHPQAGASMCLGFRACLKAPTSAPRSRQATTTGVTRRTPARLKRRLQRSARSGVARGAILEHYRKHISRAIELMYESVQDRFRCDRRLYWQTIASGWRSETVGRISHSEGVCPSHASRV